MIIIAIYTRGQAARGKEQGGRGKEWGGKGDKGERGKGGGEGQRWGVSLRKNLTHYLQVYPSWNTIQSKTGPVSE